MGAALVKGRLAVDTGVDIPVDDVVDVSMVVPGNSILMLISSSLDASVQLSIRPGGMLPSLLMSYSLEVKRMVSASSGEEHAHIVPL